MIPITLITPTGMRLESLQRCASFVHRFTGPYQIQWIIVDDGPKPSFVECDRRIQLCYIRPEHRWVGNHTLAKNLVEAVPFVTSDLIFFIEDDDWYAPDYLEFMVDEFQLGKKIIGEFPSFYYYVPRRLWKNCDNRMHASLCQTAIHADLLPLLKRICHNNNNGQGFVDIGLWNSVPSTERVLIHGTHPHCIGIKGMPGRSGIGMGHRPDSLASDWVRDEMDLSQLQKWIGDDVFLYQP